MDSKKRAREIVEKEFRRNKRKNQHADDSSEDDERGSQRRKRPLITPTQVKIKDQNAPVAESQYRDRAKERREGKLKRDDEDDIFDWKQERRKEPISVPSIEKEEPVEIITGRFQTREEAQEYLQSNPSVSTVLGRAIVRFWLTRWQKMNPNAPPKISSSVYTMTKETYPSLLVMPSEKSYPSTTNRSAMRPLLPEDLLQQIRRACKKEKERPQTTNEKAAVQNTATDAEEDDDEDIFDNLGDYDDNDESEQDADAPTRKGEKVVLFQPYEPEEVAPVITFPVRRQNRSSEHFSSAPSEVDYHEDESSEDEKKSKKKRRKKQRSGSDSE
ncbi:hypothetical protein FisN_21Hh186 [Fistulifera solaris]|jgi:hypothetical protein|uniref:Uncharacterized protein n=1 Tax=Fistulifera solaris TaxID=1519565 RepID=A0A1Z5JSK5_FISSO|nr:hypothetical protein FisN_21Hh186 [Fistulifera solaris]|eukprot:GAX16741.1 hypothetical protein FisN_21Hh186 [Fistulifera solaris]